MGVLGANFFLDNFLSSCLGGLQWSINVITFVSLLWLHVVFLTEHPDQIAAGHFQELATSLFCLFLSDVLQLTRFLVFSDALMHSTDQWILSGGMASQFVWSLCLFCYTFHYSNGGWRPQGVHFSCGSGSSFLLGHLCLQLRCKLAIFVCSSDYTVMPFVWLGWTPVAVCVHHSWCICFCVLFSWWWSFCFYVDWLIGFKVEQTCDGSTPYYISEHEHFFRGEMFSFKVGGVTTQTFLCALLSLNNPLLPEWACVWDWLPGELIGCCLDARNLRASSSKFLEALQLFQTARVWLCTSHVFE